MRYQPTVDVWALDTAARAKLQPGQWITAGGVKGRWCGLTLMGVSVANWSRDHKRTRLLIKYATQHERHTQ